MFHESNDHAAGAAHRALSAYAAHTGTEFSGDGIQGPHPQQLVTGLLAALHHYAEDDGTTDMSEALDLAQKVYADEVRAEQAPRWVHARARIKGYPYASAPVLWDANSGHERPCIRITRDGVDELAEALQRVPRAIVNSGRVGITVRGSDDAVIWVHGDPADPPRMYAYEPGYGGVYDDFGADAWQWEITFTSQEPATV